MSDENDGFTVIWKIKNFNYCLQKELEPLTSPSFVVSDFGGIGWKLLLYPRGDGNAKDVAFYLHRKNDGLERISLDYELCILSEDGIPFQSVEVKDHPFPMNHGFGAHSFIPWKDITEKNRDNLLPEDTLTLRCRMWYSGIDPSPKGCTLSTCIGIDKGTFDWPIRRFSTLRINEERTLSLEPSSRDYPSILLKMSLTGGNLCDRRVKIEICQTDTKKPSYVLLNVQVLSVYGKALDIAEAENFFEKNEGLQVWKFPPFITKEKLIGKSSVYLPGDVLTLKCSCVLSIGIVSEDIEYLDPQTKSGHSSNESFSDLSSVHNSVQRDIISTPRRRRLQNAQMIFPDRSDLSEISQGFRSDLQSLYQDQIFPDFTLRACGKSFPVHKALLSARSPVLKAMFTNEMREHNEDFTDVSDVDSETMHRFLCYVYTDITEENLDWSAASKLYFVADKYEVMPLKEKCSGFLKGSLCPENALEILELADLHQDGDLKSCVLQFILMNDHLIIGSDEWKKFEKSNPVLAYDTMKDVYLMKLNLQKGPNCNS